jgi:hypothetical protein
LQFTVAASATEQLSGASDDADVSSSVVVAPPHEALARKPSVVSSAKRPSIAWMLPPMRGQVENQEPRRFFTA